MEKNSILNTIDHIASFAKCNQLAHLSVQDEFLNGTNLQINEEAVINFGSCSYLGLEFDERLRTAAKSAIDCYGTQFSSSRAYLSLKCYETLENKLSALFKANAVVVPTTTLGHIGAIPALIESCDAIIMDHQVHNSVQTAVSIAKSKGVHVEVLRHNRMDILENRINELKGQYKKIWYMADGIYSMFGDIIPLNEVNQLLEKYEQLWVYIDDAHGMSSTGLNGCGIVYGSGCKPERIIVAVSFAKAFATGGGALIFPTKEMADRIRNCASTLITSGPMQPSALAAANACADIHLSGEIHKYQQELAEKIRYAYHLLKKAGLPDLAEPTTPIFFIAVGFPKVAYNLIHRMKQSGFYMNLGIFPAVPIKNTGVRFTITRLHSFEQIDAMVEALKHHYPLALKDEGVTVQQIYQAFKLPLPEEKQLDDFVKSAIHHTHLTTNHFKSASNLPADEWNVLMTGRGIFDQASLLVLEKSFSGNRRKEDNWNFDYFIIRDSSGKPVLATFTTCSITKDDMLSHEAISFDIEQKRINDPYFFTSRTLSLGCQLTEGNHLYLDYESPLWKDALRTLFDRLEKLQNKYRASTVMLRDLPHNNQMLDEFMIANGFFKVALPESYLCETKNWTSEDQFYQQLSKRSKRHYRENIKRYDQELVVTRAKQVSPQELEECYSLYRCVKQNSLALNTFELPYKLFEEINNTSSWEIIRLYRASDLSKCVGMALSRGTGDLHTGVLVGFDYEVNATVPVYRRLLKEVIMTALSHQAKVVSFGFSAGIEKRKFGAKPQQQCAYMQVKDNYKMEALYHSSVHYLTQRKNEFSVVEGGVQRIRFRVKV